jgi:HK97 gp10 family phage protein
MRTAFKIRTKWVVPPAAIAQKHKGALMEALDRTAIQITNDMTDSLSVGFPPSSSPGEPPHKRTARLIRSLGWEKKGDLTRVVGSGLKGDANYAIFLEFGTRPHTVPVGKKGFLAWATEFSRNTRGTLKKGGWVFTRKPVEQPGLEARPFLRPALRKNANMLGQTVAMILAAMRLSPKRV